MKLLVLTSVLLAVCTVEAHYDVAGVKYLEGLSEITGLRGLAKRAPNVALSFKAHNREFTLDLVPHETPFNEESVFTYVENGQAKTFDVDTSVYYSGTAKFGEEGTALIRIDTDSNTITGMIHGRQESFGIETTRHLSNATLKQHPMMIYKLSDIDSNEEYCGVTAEDIPKVPTLLNQVNTMTKRQASKVCTLAVVTDYHFYTALNSDKFAVANRIMDIFVAADGLFKAQNVVGLQLAHTVIYTDTASDPFYSTNAAADKGTFLNALRDSVAPTLPPTDKCVNHALTHNSWAGVVGYAHTGSACLPTKGGSSVGTSLAFGLTRPLSQIILSTTHEIGHNFGAPHDSSGKYIMAPSGGFDSIFEFSQASLNSMASGMSSRTCLINNAPFAYCGNGLLDDGEQCDCGRSCPSTYCNADCTLKPGYQCQPSNGACCAANGQFKAAGTICGAKTYGFIPEPRCTGNSALCPNCYPAGSHPCNKYSNLEPCDCPANECGACCRQSPTGSCLSASAWNLEMYMADGVCCYSNGTSGTMGVCQSGYCRNSAGDIIDAPNPNAKNDDDSNVSGASGTVVNAILSLFGLALYYLQ